MTCREKLMMEHPEYISDRFCGDCRGCPDDYGYLPPPENCWYTQYKNCDYGECRKCWDREIPDSDS